MSLICTGVEKACCIIVICILAIPLNANIVAVVGSANTSSEQISGSKGDTTSNKETPTTYEDSLIIDYSLDFFKDRYSNLYEEFKKNLYKSETSNYTNELFNRLNFVDGKVKVIIELNEPPASSYKQSLLVQDSNDNINKSVQVYTENLKVSHNKVIDQLINPNINFDLSMQYNQVFNGLSGYISPRTINDIEKLPGVKGIYLDQRMNISLSDSVPLINADEVWNLIDDNGKYITGKDVVVAVIDTGIDYTHPDLGGGLGPNYKVIGGYDFINKDKDPIDDHGHGTHCAGIIAGTGEASGGLYKGVAPDAKLLAYKVLSSQGYGYLSDIIAAVDMAIDPDKNPTTDDGADIISMSLGGLGDENSPLSRAVDNAVNAGVIVVVAAGNEGGYGYFTIGSPAQAKNAITVGSSTHKIGSKDSGGPDKISWFSSKGPTFNYNIKPDLVAPGGDVNLGEGGRYVDGIVSARAKGTSMGNAVNEHYTKASGTSMATPHVAGAAALLRQKYPTFKPSFIKALLSETTIDIGYNVRTQGAGRLDVYNAIKTTLAAIPSTLNLGIVDTPPWVNNTPLTIYNLGSNIENLQVSVIGNYPSGIVVSVDRNELVLNGGKSGIITLSVTVEDYAPEAYYEGYIKIENAKNLLRVPYLFLNIRKPDLGTDSYLESPFSMDPALGEANTITVPIYNRGAICATKVNVTFFELILAYPVGLFPVEIGSYIIDIASRSQTTAQIQWVPSSKGVIGIAVVIDLINEISEINEEDNIGIALCEVKGSDLIPIDLLLGSPIVEGKQVTVKAIVKNIGDHRAKEILVQLKANNEEIHCSTISLLGPNTQQIIDLVWSPSVAGLYDIQVVVDPYNSIIELDENNNIISDENIIVVTATGVDLSPIGVNFEPTPVVQNQAIVLSARIYNFGAVISPITIVHFFDNGIKIGSKSLSSIASGTFRVIRTSWVPETIGPHTLSVQVDPNNYITEVHEDNNFFTQVTQVFSPASWTKTNYNTHNTGYTAFSSITRTYNPTKLWEYQSSTFEKFSSPVIADIDNDGGIDVITTSEDKNLYVFDKNGNVKWMFYVDSDVYGAPSIADIDYDGKNEIVFVSGNSTLYCLLSNGMEKWNTSLCEYPSFTVASPVIADITSDNGLEIIVGTGIETLSPWETRTNIICINSIGRFVWRYTESIFLGCVFSVPAVSDVDADGNLEIICTICAGTSKVLLLSSSGVPKWCWEVLSDHAPVVIDIDNDNYIEILMVGFGSKRLCCLDFTGNIKWSSPLENYPLMQPSLGDIDKDGFNEIMIGLQQNLTCLNSSDGSVRWKCSVSENSSHYLISSLTLADLDGDGFLETLVASRNGKLYCINSTGKIIWNYTIDEKEIRESFVVVTDLDGDNIPEILLSSYLEEKCSFLFGLPISYKEYLKEGPVENALKNAFADHNIILSNNALISQINVYLWRITDSMSEYRILDTYKQLRIYNYSKPKSSIYAIDLEPKIETHTYFLKKGWNIITLTSIPMKKYTSYILGEDIPGKECIYRWDKTSQGWKYGLFDIVVGEGYLVGVSKDTSFSLTGYEIPKPTTLELVKGLNLVGIQKSEVSYTSFTLLRAIPNCVEVYRWNATISNWDSAVLTSAGLSGTDFPIVDDSGYFVKVTQSIEWTPKLIKKSIHLKAGWNLISLPLYPMAPYTSYTLKKEIPGHRCIYRWDATKQGYQSGLFDIKVGEGYFVLALAETTLTFTGYAIESPVALELKSGWNLIGIPYSNPTHTAYTLLENLPNNNKIARWDTITKSYQTAVEESGTLSGYDFPIVSGEGYWLYVPV